MGDTRHQHTGSSRDGVAASGVPEGGLAGVGAVSGISSWRMELMKVVGDRGVSTGRASTSRAGHTSASGLGGSSFTWTGWFSLQKAAGG